MSRFKQVTIEEMSRKLKDRKVDVCTSYERESDDDFIPYAIDLHNVEIEAVNGGIGIITDNGKFSLAVDVSVVTRFRDEERFRYCYIIVSADMDEKKEIIIKDSEE